VSNPIVTRCRTEEEIDRCFACDRPLHGDVREAMTIDGQIVRVGPDCYRKIVEAGPVLPYLPPKGGPGLIVKKGATHAP